MTHYGRPSGEKNTSGKGENHDAHTAAGRILALGCALLAGFLVSVTIPRQTEDAMENGIPSQGVAAVMSTAVGERENLTRPNETEEKTDAGAEPFGYLDGEWNLWEYIGDLMWSLLG